MPWAQLVVQALDGGTYAVALVQGLIMIRKHWQVYAMHHNATLSMPTKDI